MFTVLDALMSLLDSNLQLMENYPDDYGIRNAFYMQAFGAVSMLQLTEHCKDAEALWMRYQPIYDKARMGG